MKTAWFAILAAAAAPLLGQQTPARPIPMAASPSFNSGFVASGEWQQATALPLDRETMQSNAFELAWRHSGWSFGAGWARIARDLSTVQGGTVSVGKLLQAGPVTFIPAVMGLVGQSYVSVDSTGYDFTNSTTNTTGHVARFSYSDGVAFGGGVGLTLEYPVYRMIGFRASAAQWFVGGDPVANNRGRTVVGVGLSVQVMP
jgi:hypothetical protein